MPDLSPRPRHGCFPLVARPLQSSASSLPPVASRPPAWQDPPAAIKATCGSMAPSRLALLACHSQYLPYIHALIHATSISSAHLSCEPSGKGEIGKRAISHLPALAPIAHSRRRKTLSAIVVSPILHLSRADHLSPADPSPTEPARPRLEPRGHVRRPTWLPWSVLVLPARFAPDTTYPSKRIHPVADRLRVCCTAAAGRCFAFLLPVVRIWKGISIGPSSFLR